MYLWILLQYVGVVNSNSPMKIGYDHCNETLSYRSNEKMYVVYKICHPMLFEFTADRIYDLFYIYISLSTVIRIRSSRDCILREDSVSSFFFSSS